MAKKTKKRSKNSSSHYDMAHIVVVLCLLCMIGIASADVPPKTHKVSKAVTISKHNPQHKKQTITKPAAMAVAKTPPPTPPTAKTTSKTVAISPSAPKSEPVVTPSPASSVSSLTPVAPTTTPPSGGSSSGSNGASGGSSGSTSGTTGSPTSTLPPVTTTAYTSSNWSGYFAANGTFSAISGSWTATTPTGNGTSTSADATWIGIGGVTTSDLIQVGTQNTVSASGQVTSAAFYELLPDFSQPVPGISIKPGDSMTASITKTTGDQWNITITDTTNGQSNSQTVTYASSLSSAEWIQEDPSYSARRQIPFDYYGSTAFTNGSATTTSGSANISVSGAQPITMVNRFGQTLSIPTVLTADGAGFSVTRDNTH